MVSEWGAPPTEQNRGRGEGTLPEEFRNGG